MSKEKKEAIEIFKKAINSGKLSEYELGRIVGKCEAVTEDKTSAQKKVET